MHRNTFIESPKLLDETLRLRPELPCAKGIPPTWFAGQITGAEGYTEAIATGWYAAWNLASTLLYGNSNPLPAESCIASLLRQLVSPNENFQPMNFNFGLLPHLQDMKKKNKKETSKRRFKKISKHKSLIRDRRVVVSLNEKEYEALSNYCRKHKIQKSDFVRRIVFSEIMAKQYAESPTLFD